MENKQAPEIRIPGFTIEWEQRKLGNHAEILTGGTPKTQIKEYWEPKEIPWMSSGEINKKRLSSTDNMISKLGFEKSSARWVRGKSVLIALAGQGKTRGTVAVNEIPLTTNQSIAAIVPESELYYEFIFQNLEKRYEELRLISSGDGTRGGLNKQLVSDVEIMSPSVKEQTKIGNFFKQLDDMIALHQQELDTLKQTKQGFLQKMFPKEGESVPEIRFPGFTGEWEGLKLDSIVDRLKSYSLSRDVETSEYTGYKYIHYGDIHTKVADVIDESSNLPNIKAGNYELLEKGDLVLADASEDYQGIATPAVITIDMPYKLVSGLHTIALRPKPKQADSLFLYYLFYSPIFRRFGYRTGTGMKVFGISVTNLLTFEGAFPSLEEQTKIGNLFKQLDETITLHQRELDTLKETKKAFLQKMFV
ncbi:restriction endonuclease subunit S [Aquibacillus sp. 3ASR75-11]|uniref:Restriction endonuclease subunit S n=1 Tax=Terrihalobacillus insolitus TaxID=2950438 RepID=A0A9X3WQY2_9BACI|nr:restriction endonuclease subunit S [Terrihalobacillus insolitus]MDC3424262.1 restriction endonuclease subunit S [Terrihalobacillus insolitus]